MVNVAERLHALEAVVAQLGYGLDGLAERIDALQEETGRRAADELEELRNRVATLELANKGLVAMIEHEVAEIDARITNVHTKALRTLTAQAERRNPA